MVKILLATDGSEHSMKTVEKSIDIARKLEAEVTIIYVIEGNPQIGYDLFAAYKKTEDELVKRGQAVLKKSTEPFKDQGITVNPRLERGHPSEIICKIADEGNFDYIILGSRGLGGVRELLLGSVSNAVAHCAKTSIIIVK